MKDDFLSADWARHHHTFTDGFFNFLMALFRWLRRPIRLLSNFGKRIQ